MLVCSKCNEENRRNARFCRFCRSSLKEEKYNLKNRLYRNGMDLLFADRWEEAIDYFDEAIVQEPVGDKVLPGKDEELSIEDYKKTFICRTLKKDPLMTDPLIYKSLALANIYKIEEAFACLDRAGRIDPGNTNLWLVKSHIFFETGNYEKALELCDLAILIHSKNACLFSDMRKKIQKRLEEIENVIIHYNNILDFNSSDFNMWNEKGEALLELKSYDKALECFEKAVELNDFFVRAFFNKGASLCGQRNYSEGLVCFDLALLIDDTYFPALYGKAITFFILFGSRKKLFFTMKKFWTFYLLR